MDHNLAENDKNIKGDEADLAHLQGMLGRLRSKAEYMKRWVLDNFFPLLNSEFFIYFASDPQPVSSTLELRVSH